MIDSISVMTASVGKTTQGLAAAQQNTVTIVDTMAAYTESIEKLIAQSAESVRALTDAAASDVNTAARLERHQSVHQDPAQERAGAPAAGNGA